MRIKNLTNSPYELIDKDGKKVTLPARGTVEIYPHAMQAGMYKNLGYFEVSESKVEPDDDDPRDALRDEYEELSGENADKRWSEIRLRSEIAKMEAPQ